MSGLEPVEYRDGATVLTGWLARPEGRPRAAIVVFPTIANVTAPVERRAVLLAGQGYLALVADFYGPAADSPETARELAPALRADPHAYRQRLAAAVRAMREHPAATGLPMGAIGYCMGGGAVLELARAGADLAVVVSFHGLLDTKLPASPGGVKARILVCHGVDDPMAPRADVIAFWDEMDRAGANWHLHCYSGVKHGFTDPASDMRGIPALGYDSSADRQSWAAATSLMDEVFGR